MTTDVAKVSENINHRNQVTIDALIKMEHQKADNQKMALEIDKAVINDPAAAERLAKSRRIMKDVVSQAISVEEKKQESAVLSRQVEIKELELQMQKAQTSEQIADSLKVLRENNPYRLSAVTIISVAAIICVTCCIISYIHLFI